MPGVKRALALPHLLGIADDGGGKTAQVQSVRYYGRRPIAAVAAQTMEQATAALGKIRWTTMCCRSSSIRRKRGSPRRRRCFAQPVTARGSAGGGGKDKLNQVGNVRGPQAQHFPEP